MECSLEKFGRKEKSAVRALRIALRYLHTTALCCAVFTYLLPTAGARQNPARRLRGVTDSLT